MDMQQPDRQIALDPKQPVNFTLLAEQANAVLVALNELPHRISRPIIDSMMQQLRMAALSPNDVAG